MAFLRSSTSHDAAPAIRGARVWLRPPASGDYAAWAELRARSRDHLTPWEPTWADDELSRTAFRRRIRHYQRELRDDLGYAFLIFARADDTLLGGLTLSNVRRGVAQAATLGYWLGAPHVGQGYMGQAIEAVVAFARDGLRLHRLEAACMPGNRASMQVLERAGFAREGEARAYLKIAGRWEDHVLFGRVLGEELRAGEPGR
jgi:ribosomal-protein-alanine N-acetyltransferase